MRSGIDSDHGVRPGGCPWNSSPHASPSLKTHARATPAVSLVEILIIAFCAMLCGTEDCSDMTLFGRAKEGFLRQFLRLPHGIPSHYTSAALSACSIR